MTGPAPETTATPRIDWRSWKFLLTAAIFLLIILFVAVYAMFGHMYKERMLASRAKAVQVRKEIEPFFTEAEDAAGNGAGYLRVLIENPELEGLDDELDKADLNAAYRRLPAIIAWNEKHPDWVAKVHAVTAYDRIRFSRDLSKGMAMDMPEMSALRRLFRVGGLLMVERARSGETEKALQLAEGLNHILVIYNEPILISYLVTIACDQTLMRRMGEAALFIDDPALIDRLIAITRTPTNSRERMINAFKGEAGLSGVWLADIGVEELGGVTGGRGMIGRLVFTFGAPYINLEKATAIDKQIEILELVQLPYDEYRKQAPAVFDIKPGFGNRIMCMIIPAVERMYTQMLLNQNVRPCWEAVFRTHKYYLAHDKTLPDDLASLEGYEAGAPVSVPGDHPLAYKVFESPLCFRVKTLQPDGKDDGFWLEPTLDTATDTYAHEEFNFNTGTDAMITGMDYYLPEQIEKEEAKAAATEPEEEN